MNKCCGNNSHAFILIFLLLVSIFISISGFFCVFEISSLYSVNKWDYCLSIPMMNYTNNSIYVTKNKNIGIPTVIIGSLYLIIISISICLIQYFWLQKNKNENSSLLPFKRRDKYLKLLYISHFFSCWGDRMWQFAIPVILMVIFKNTFIPTAIYSIIIYLGNILAMPLIGKWIDKNNRFQVQKKSIIIENLMIVVSSLVISIFPFFVNIDEIDLQNKYVIVGAVVTILFGIIGEIMNNAQNISTEKDWVIIISKSTDYPINNINKIMKRIDLICKILAPAVIGIIIDRFDNHNQKIFVAGLVIGTWNILSFPLEIILKNIVYSEFPELRRKIHTHINGITHNHMDGEKYHQHLDGSDYLDDIEYIDLNSINDKQEKCLSFSLYFNHPICLASLSAGMIWMTVLSNGSIMTNYLQWRNINLTLIGAGRGLGALMGVMGTYLFGWLNSKTQNENKTAVISLWCFWLYLLPILFAFIFFGKSRTSDYTLMGCCILSRIMMWMFELSLQNIMQKNIEEENRGKINTMHTTIYQTFYILINIFGIIFFKPEHFIYLVIISLSAVGTAVFTLSYWYKKFITNSI
jgi:solute carrier family 40 (iron-regulated transporter), member 1